MLAQRRHAEAGGAREDAPRLSLTRAQLKKRRHQLSFTSSENQVGADYGKRVVLPRNAAWESAHAAVRVTTVPHGFQGEVWPEDAA